MGVPKEQFITGAQQTKPPGRDRQSGELRISFTKLQIKANARDILRSDGELAAANYLVDTLFGCDLDKSGQPYLGHLQRVASNVDPELRPGALMHDLIEDKRTPEKGGWTFRDLEDIGFCEHPTIGIVRAMTKHVGERHFDAIVRLSEYAPAIPVKRADMMDNSNPVRLRYYSGDDGMKQIEKYYLSGQYLRDVQKGRIEPGTDFGQWMLGCPHEFQDWAMLARESSSKVRSVQVSNVIPAGYAFQPIGLSRR